MRAVFSLCVALAGLLAPASAVTIQGNCTTGDEGLAWAAGQLSAGAAIACRGSPLQLANAARYWGEQVSKNASVVVYPTSAADVSLAVQAARRSPYGGDFAFVSGGHGQTGAASANGFVIDLSRMNQTRIIRNASAQGLPGQTLIAYEGGCKWLDVLSVTNGTGYTPVSGRVSSIGVGGFSTGGGIGFLAGAYGYAMDRLRAMEVVLMSGQSVFATKTNEHSDLFFALQGGGGQFGIVSTFYQEAAPEPTKLTIGQYFLDLASTNQSTVAATEWFEQNRDPFSILYWAIGLLPADPAQPTADVAVRAVYVTLQFGDPTNAAQASYDDTFAPLLKGVNVTGTARFELPYADITTIFDPYFPYGFRRGFYGPQTTRITPDYLARNAAQFAAHAAHLAAANDTAPSGIWGIQYMSPGLNGNLPPRDNETAWPHAISGHQTLFSPAYSKPEDDALVLADNDAFNRITWDHQSTVGPFIADYPNYISPDAPGWRVWGNNVQRLIDIKTKYDPECRIHNGRVFASRACVEGGWANIFP